MKKITTYLRTAFYSMRKNSVSSLFCIATTAVTFIFIALILQLLRIYAGGYPPMTNADRIIRLESFQDTEGKSAGGIWYTEANAFLESLKGLGFEYASLYHPNSLNVEVNGRLRFGGLAFVNEDFWKLFDFELLYGRPFSADDCANRRAVVVITENVSQLYFNTANSIGKKFRFQQREYEVVGVVKDPSMLAAPTEICNIWAPWVFNKFIPNGTYTYTVDVLAPPAMPVGEAKEKTARAVQQYFDGKNVKVDFPAQKIQTLNVNTDGNMLQYGGVIALLLFLLIPALNILSFGIVNTSNHAEEIAVRKAFGATRVASFLQIMADNLLLVICGALIGLALAVPAINIIQASVVQSSFLNTVSLVSGIDFGVIFGGVLPAALVFSLLSGGIPAYLIAKRPVAKVLKGGSK
jgi:ABC-type antimicrobial peptide transport system permease subunit